MNYRYIVLTFLLALAVVSPALLAVRGIFLGSHMLGDRWFLALVELVGWYEIAVVTLASAMKAAMHDWGIIAKAKAELDALKAGMRGEG